MGSDLLSIGKGALLAAQVGLSTTGHNIANANVPGYNRQQVLQGSGPAQDQGFGFVGSGTVISQVRRVYNDFLTQQVRSAQNTVNSTETFNGQVSQIDNLFADATSGLSPALQDFFKGVQDVSSNPASTASRQALLSSANALAARFQGLSGRLDEIRDGVNKQIDANVTLINSLASGIANLNQKIGSLGNIDGKAPNDLLDQRDQLVADLNKQIKTTVTPGSNNSLTVSIGSGQPLVVGVRAFELATTASLTDPGRTEVGYVTARGVAPLATSVLSGGELGGLYEFRAQVLDRAQNSLGRIALGIAVTVNAQQRLGLDQAGNFGADLFTQSPVTVARSADNNLQSTTVVTAAISDPSKLTVSDYKLSFNGINFVVTRQSDNKQTPIAPFPQTGPQTIDGVDFTVTGVAATGDSFLIRPTATGASGFNLALTDRAEIAAAGPVTTSIPVGNKGTATLGDVTIDATYVAQSVPATNPATFPNRLVAPLTLTYNTADNTLSGLAATNKDVTVTNNGVATVFSAGTFNDAIPFTSGATISVGGISVAVTGVPANNDTFTLAPNVNGVGDNRNIRAIGQLQTTTLFDSGSTTFQGAYAEAVNFIGNKTRESQINNQAAVSLLASATQSQQEVSGVNLDEEASNLLRYQQAYQAAGKALQIASTLFDVLLSLGR